MRGTRAVGQLRGISTSTVIVNLRTSAGKNEELVSRIIVLPISQEGHRGLYLRKDTGLCLLKSPSRCRGPQPTVFLSGFNLAECTGASGHHPIVNGVCLRCTQTRGLKEANRQ